jgi:hypothetical protein
MLMAVTKQIIKSFNLNVKLVIEKSKSQVRYGSWFNVRYIMKTLFKAIIIDMRKLVQIACLKGLPFINIPIRRASTQIQHIIHILVTK